MVDGTHWGVSHISSDDISAWAQVPQKKYESMYYLVHVLESVYIVCCSSMVFGFALWYHHCPTDGSTYVTYTGLVIKSAWLLLLQKTRVWFPIPHQAAHNCLKLQFQVDSMPSFWPPWQMHRHVYTHRHIHIKQNEIFNIFSSVHLFYRIMI